MKTLLTPMPPCRARQSFGIRQLGAAVTLGALVCLPMLCSAGQDIQSRFAKSISQARALTNVEVQTIETHRRTTNGGGPQSSFTVQNTYVASGRKFRATRMKLSATETNSIPLAEAAFNGESFVAFVVYDAVRSTMTRHAEVPGSTSGEPGSDTPLTAPFLFLAKNSDDCPTCLLRFTDIAAPDFAKDVRLPTAQSSNGVVQLSMRGLPLAQKPTSWQISLDAAGDAFTPNTISITIEAGMQIVWRFLNYTNLGGYRFPTRVESTASAYPATSSPTLISTKTETVISARIPDRVADSVFNLKEQESAAGTVWGSDDAKLLKSGPPAETCPASQRPRALSQ